MNLADTMTYVTVRITDEMSNKWSQVMIPKNKALRNVFWFTIENFSYALIVLSL